MTSTEIRKLSQTCGATLAGARDRALFLIGFAGALRRSELVGLDVAHVTWTSEGHTLLIERAKTDADGKGADAIRWNVRVARERVRAQAKGAHELFKQQFARMSANAEDAYVDVSGDPDLHYIW